VSNVFIIMKRVVSSLWFKIIVPYIICPVIVAQIISKYKSINFIDSLIYFLSISLPLWLVLIFSIVLIAAKLKHTKKEYENPTLDKDMELYFAIYCDNANIGQALTLSSEELVADFKSKLKNIVLSPKLKAHMLKIKYMNTKGNLTDEGITYLRNRIHLVDSIDTL